MPSLLNDAFLRLTKRAERNDRSKLVTTFVDVGPLFTLISNEDHQVIYGRRGTGKTHALSYLAETKQVEGDVAVYLDMRTIGSTGGLYADTSISLPQRGTHLLVDTLRAIHNELLTFFIQYAETYDLSQAGPILDQFADAINNVVVTGSVEREENTTNSSSTSTSSKIDLQVNKDGFQISSSDSSENNKQLERGNKLKETGIVESRVNFGAVGRILNDMSKLIQSKRVWILLDEWSSVPLELQPYLADLLRRSVFPVSNFTVKIATIEQRSSFRIPLQDRDYIGIELGADMSADVNLDDFMVFDNDAERATQFFKELLFKHVNEVDGLDVASKISSSDEMIQQGFTQRAVFEEFTRATEGVPRDAINIITLAAQKALDGPISIADIRNAARNWYQRDKEASTKSNEDAHALLHWIIDSVIGQRRARAFLIQNDSIPELIETLFDARILHVLKKNISARDKPGIRYDVYKLDYGCYVDLINTSQNPLGLLSSENEQGQDMYIDVPPDDYRAIRRAILNIDDFLRRQLPLF